MEKRRPHYSLAEVKAMALRNGPLAFTRTARESIRMMGLSLDIALNVIA